jgi:hypothetical protein
MLAWNAGRIINQGGKTTEEYKMGQPQSKLTHCCEKTSPRIGPPTVTIDASELRWTIDSGRSEFSNSTRHIAFRQAESVQSTG